jgi:AbrB family looped-hinge helix DNA binding protein
MSSKGQLTVPKPVRDALGISEGDTVVFRVEGDRAVMARTPDFVSLAGTIEVPPARRGAEWGDIVREVRSARGKHRR